MSPKALLFKSTLNPAWPHFLGAFSVLLALISGLGHWLLTGWTDPMQCQALLNDGSWLGSDHQKWQPDGCMLYPYTEPEDASTCLKSKEVIFIGDSVVRKLFFQTAHLLDASLPNAPVDSTKKHADHTLHTKYGTNLTFSWDPFLNSSYTDWILTEASAARSEDRPRPAMLVMGSGLWHLRYSNTSGGIVTWEGNTERIFQLITTRPKAADKIVILPVEHIVPEKLSADRASMMHLSDIDAMNSDLYHRIHPPAEFSGSKSIPPAISEIALPLVFNKMLDESLTDDGLHYSDSVVRAQAQILLNLRCNDILPKTFPLNKTCCNRYPIPSILQSGFFLFVVFLGPYVAYRVYKQGSFSLLLHDPRALPPLIFSMSIALIFLADRTSFWLKEHKYFDPWTFTFLCLLSLVIGIATVKRGDSDAGVLNRDQTDEWKGWMQTVILIYHYLHGSQVSGIYNPIRMLVASYLFMTGYGHTTYYLRKADYGPLRIMQVLIRLNIFTILLAYTMNTDYISYYFTPLVSMWYIVIYLTMAAGARFNDRAPMLVFKIALSAALMKWFMNESWLLEAIFDVLHRFCAIHWSAQEWAFRVNLDMGIVFVGMLTAVVITRVREHRLMDHPYWPTATRVLVTMSGLVMIWYFVFAFYQESKFAYNVWHPYISFLPVLSFVILRNANALLRSSSSQAFAFAGRCSLELFVVQYHFWLAGDSKGVLLVIPGTRWRPINFVITTVMFIYVCDRISYAAGELTKSICGMRTRELPLPLPVTTSAAAEITVSDEFIEDGGQELATLLPGKFSSTKDGGQGPSFVEPDTPIRPAHWVERPPAEDSTQPSTVGRHLAFLLNNGSRSWTLYARIALFLGVLWLSNILWDDA
ncbi:O-acetyltransferase [Agrocybe pediades]|nr:O-acetyltransferase [Agrocybe pediades]